MQLIAQEILQTEEILSNLADSVRAVRAESGVFADRQSLRIDAAVFFK